MADIIDFYDHPVAYIRKMKSMNDKIDDLIEFFIRTDDNKKLYIVESLTIHKGDSAIILCGKDYEPICAWIVKSEEVGISVCNIRDHSAHLDNSELAVLLHITDDDIFGFGPVSFNDALQFASSMPRAEWFSNITMLDL